MTQQQLNIYPAVEVDQEQNQFMKLKFILLEKDWPYPNFDMIVQYNDPIMIVSKELEERHGGIANLRLYTDGERLNELPTKFNLKIGDVLQVKGSILKQDAPTVNVFYDFKLVDRCPIQLF